MIASVCRRDQHSTAHGSEGAVITGIETAVLKVGQTIAQRAATAWLARRRSAKERASTLVELAAMELSSPLQQNKLLHAIEGIGNEVAEQLQSLLRGAPENEVCAALNAGGDAVTAADLSDDALFAADVDGEVLARRIRQSVREPVGLSDVATRLYGIVLDQSCRYLVQVIQQLPAFQPRALSEVLGRLTSLSGQLAELLSRTPRASLEAPQGTNHDEAFRTRYLDHLAKTLDKLELLGLSMRQRPRLDLSLAYLSLTASAEERIRGKAHKTIDRWSQKRRAHVDTLRIEAALAGSDRTLVRGEAGSGKTTLLDWLAVGASRASFTDQLTEWNGLTPFVIRLRRCVDTDLPKPAQFLEHVAPMLAGLMPHLWVERQLSSQRALVLIDGVDEVPPAKRRAARLWLHELVTTFRGIKCVVTSRPAAAERNWLAEEGFGSVDLDQMSPNDVRIFLQRWHEAAAQAKSLPCEPGDLPAAEQRLLTQLDDRAHLRALATNPLLCAMLCALNLDRVSELPSKRMELYHLALGMLLNLRDSERNIPGLLDVTDQTVLLRDLAWRLTQANRTELPRDKVLTFVTQKLPSMPNVDEDPAKLVDHLLERSGVVREPTPGRVDFVHRTFQEYLAASEATETEHIDTLVANAHLDQWRETIVMACGHAKRPQLKELLTAILDRADAEPTRARRLRLLAAACLETVSDADPDVLGRIDEMIRTKLVPPRSVRETRSLNSIGHRLLRYLPSSLEELTEPAAAATVKAAVLTADPEALPLLAEYARDGRQRVQEELASGWQRFNFERYASEVLAEANLPNGSMWISFGGAVRHLDKVSKLTDLTLFINGSEVGELARFANPAPLRSLTITNGKNVNVSQFADYPNLKQLEVWDARKVTNIASLSRAASLDELTLMRCGKWRELSPFAKLEHIKELSLYNLENVTDYTPLSQLHNLTKLILFESTGLTAIDEIGGKNGLLNEYFPNLATVMLDGGGMRDISAVRHLPLRCLSLTECPIEDISTLADAPTLHILYLDGCQKEIDLSPLANHPALRAYITEGQKVCGVDRLGPGVEIRYG
ncbi:NACHT N-terminal Helical domain 1-containing protein [Kutzneria sp. CA-103260]|uniref:NACHT N-terminal Helical domain 1-containing protein n=1 Tax=Kutzneria sp. CA-103260 TaxID=2802641 RepID=UPI001BA797EC|nr:NACHT domain-containing protein [Kutzneria sp. CA-103260]QUQ68475.1 large ATP-binding protein [Kutzneria sp. CA-103260]